MFFGNFFSPCFYLRAFDFLGSVSFRHDKGISAYSEVYSLCILCVVRVMSEMKVQLKGSLVSVGRDDRVFHRFYVRIRMFVFTS